MLSKARFLLTDRHFSEVLTGSAWVVASKVLDVSSALLCSVVIARLYGAETIGIVALLYSSLIITSMFALFGFQISIVRLIPEHIVKYSPNSAFRVYRKVRILVFLIGFLVSLTCYFAAAPIAKILLKGQSDQYFPLTACFLLAYCSNVFFTQSLRGLKLVRLFALFQMLPNLINLVLLFILSRFGVDPAVPVYAMLCSYLISALLSLAAVEINFLRITKTNDTIYEVSHSELIDISFPMMFNSAMTILMAQSGYIMVGIFRGEAEVGYFNIAVKLGTLTSFVLIALNPMIGPKISELFHKNEIALVFRMVRQSSIFMLCLTSPIAIALLAFGKSILTLFYGSDFVVAYKALVFLVLGQFFNAASGSTGLFMNMTGDEKVYGNIVAVTAVLSLIASLFLIPETGIVGAAIIIMTSMISWNLTILVFQKRKYGKTTCALF